MEENKDKEVTIEDIANMFDEIVKAIEKMEEA